MCLSPVHSPCTVIAPHDSRYPGATNTALHHLIDCVYHIIELYKHNIRARRLHCQYTSSLYSQQTNKSL